MHQRRTAASVRCLGCVTKPCGDASHLRDYDSTRKGSYRREAGMKQMPRTGFLLPHGVRWSLPQTNSNLVTVVIRRFHSLRIGPHIVRSLSVIGDFSAMMYAG